MPPPKDGRGVGGGSLMDTSRGVTPRGAPGGRGQARDASQGGQIFALEHLVDPGATHSFVSPTFMFGIDVKAERLPYDPEMKSPTDNQSLLANEMYRNCDIWVGEQKLVVDLISLAIKEYDVILGMDWLAHYHARVDCRMKVVEFCIPVNTLGEKSKLEDTAVINEYPDMFPEELVSLPPEREIEFKIDLAPRTNPMSKNPYRMAPVELKELKFQLQDLLEPEFINESESPWGAPVLFVKKKDER
ncbi:uncharacterized protein LOC113768540 [Coffea eugenioides]|uniref:uncharacterized protein LOC113758282 n=1 Tax=Coffea eugenioides TaxID=49369 RepID=UPI000F606333|nr:uncharacterized protein LOC113758282 [Coffea eugenioides]XP_027168746.1 uncharacterized protein LOC113768540 [Coffea eugenioides]